MEKLSGILPTNKRITNVNLAGAPAVRPGAPQFGRPMGSTAALRKERMEARIEAEKALARQAHQSVGLSATDTLKISPEAHQKVQLEALSTAPKLPQKTQSAQGVGEVLKPVNVVEQKVTSEIKNSAAEDSDLIAYPEETRDLLNKTSIVNQLINEMPEATGTLLNREDEEV